MREEDGNEIWKLKLFAKERRKLNNKMMVTLYNESWKKKGKMKKKEEEVDQESGNCSQYGDNPVAILNVFI